MNNKNSNQCQSASEVDEVMAMTGSVCGSDQVSVSPLLLSGAAAHKDDSSDQQQQDEHNDDVDPDR